MAMLCMLPIPVAGIMPQSVPIVAIDSCIGAECDAAARGEAAGAVLVVPPQAAAATVSATAMNEIAAGRPPLSGRVSAECIVSPGRGNGGRAGCGTAEGLV